MSIYDPNVLAGKRILITGGGTGLGRGVAGHLVKHGAQVHLWGRRTNVLEEAAAEIGGRARTSRPSTSVTPTRSTPRWARSGASTGRSPG